MKKVYYARIKWLDISVGRKTGFLPSGVRYSPLIKLPNGEVWSIVFTTTPMNEENKSYVEFCFLADCAPEGLLYEQMDFSLYEGNTKVADGVVLSIVD